MSKKYLYPLSTKDYHSLETLIRKYTFETIYRICDQLNKEIISSSIYYKKYNIEKPIKNLTVLEHDHYWILKQIISANGNDETKFVLRYIKNKNVKTKERKSNEINKRQFDS
ncbi:hypothetical protein EMELA_v1c03550 [Mesoplasma melaleucae]|uniref:Uncharacterized protein n=1 Tax=Mesoplasma melaleucae TaxID=81459 RepID=A0A2K8NVJ4_9MOLU|nr:hypothetical protein [Mesoplasma melaleucae]ATZ17839.1 hypothetical protein EMELA_v1c02660 [Mesoplasma melaleucae]ATZ17917.1 hypothetical protein EMELA_v1c03550 [Mesoplasma melaleucae]